MSIAFALDMITGSSLDTLQNEHFEGMTWTTISVSIPLLLVTVPTKQTSLSLWLGLHSHFLKTFSSISSVKITGSFLELKAFFMSNDIDCLSPVTLTKIKAKFSSGILAMPAAIASLQDSKMSSIIIS